jgi:25S rRNA (adenine2142-N1)-methyltransferase
MLRLSRRHLRNDGHMFLVLPLPCVDNSRYMDETRLLAILKAVGYELVLKQHTPKLAMYMVRAVSADSAEPKTFGKELIRGGKERNNFAIVLK